MARKCLLAREVKREKLVERYADRRAALKAKVIDENATFDERFDAMQALAKLPRDSAKTRKRNRCVTTGRSRGVYRKFNLCRIELRRLAHEGHLPGVTKSSW